MSRDSRTKRDHEFKLTNIITGRRTRHCKLRPRIHLRAANRFLRRRPHALFHNAATVRRLVVQSSCGRSGRRRWQCEGPKFRERGIDFAYHRKKEQACDYETNVMTSKGSGRRRTRFIALGKSLDSISYQCACTHGTRGGRITASSFSLGTRKT